LTTFSHDYRSNHACLSQKDNLTRLCVANYSLHSVDKAVFPRSDYTRYIDLYVNIVFNNLATIEC